MYPFCTPFYIPRQISGFVTLKIETSNILALLKTRNVDSGTAGRYKTSRRWQSILKSLASHRSFSRTNF
jgi:hypothetical protein